MSCMPVVLKARAVQHTATMIFLHGLGDSGHGWAGILNTIRPDYMKIVCPSAPSMPVTINGGAVMPAWYDINLETMESYFNMSVNSREDFEGVEKSTKVLESLIDIEARELGTITDGTAGKSRIIIGGFSQGGVIALNAILRAKDKLAGCVALSTYLAGKHNFNNIPL